MSDSDIEAGDVAHRVIESDADDLVVLDVRNEPEYEEWHIPGSTNIPVYDELLDYDYSGLEANLDAIPEDEEIAVVCVAGVTSARAADFLQDHGYDAKSIPDGMNAWGRVHRTYAVPGVDGVVQVVRPGTGCLSYVVYDGGEAVVVDPSQYIDQYLGIADDRGLDIVGVIDTHAHADHVSGGRRLAGELDIPYYLHPEDAGALDDFTPLTDGDTVGVGDRPLQTDHTPGHTPGSVSLDWGDGLLAGDTLFLESVGRPDLEDGDNDAIRTASRQLFDSLETLTNRPDDTVVLPGHFSDESMRPIATDLGTLRSTTSNELLGYVEAGDGDAFVETIVAGLSDEPANYTEIKQINCGRQQPGSDVEALELGPNNCAAN